jgi:quinol monooxygenase YgiN
MIGVVATIEIQADKTADFEAHFSKLAAQVRAKEPGCLLYRLAKSREIVGGYKVMELYQDQAAVDHHMGTDYFKAAFEQFGGLITGAPSIESLDIVD